MYFDLDQGAPQRLEADVAVIGAGAAGITMCRRLLAGGASVILLESGGLDYEAAIAALNAGDIVGQNYYPLEDARLRFFGGTTAIWGGRSVELTPIDFERRSWVPHSGWPIKALDLERYYREARIALGLPTDAPSAAALGDILPNFHETRLTTPLWTFDNQSDRFSFARTRDVVEHPRCTVVTHATVSEIIARANGGSIDRLAARSLKGTELDVRARHIVLAAGGIENPRLLLASRSVMPTGLGNDHDQVGRYFMEHPHARGGRIVGDAAWAWLRAFQKRSLGGTAVAPTIALSPQMQAANGWLNTSLTVAGRRSVHAQEALLMAAYQRIKHKAPPTRSGRMVWRTVKRSVGALQRMTHPLRPWLLNRLSRLDIALVVRAEQAPNPDSRVTLSDKVDGLGMPRVALDWRTTALDVESVLGLVNTLGEETRRLSLGRVEPASWLDDPSHGWVTDPLISVHPIGGYHHMGTTRMTHDPRRGVTDAFGRVHGLDNLYIAGSSLFPTSGWANPTLTIIALAMRAGDHILGRLGQSPGVRHYAESERNLVDAT